jgi:formylglycine-generating enzyme required for sulfatase activity
LGYKKPEMKPSTVAASLVIASSVLSSNVSASVIIDYITVGNVGNAADATGYGAVGYQYQIGKYEVTNAQYAEFLNAKAKTNNYGLYNSNMASYGITQSGGSGNFTYNVTSGMENRPVVFVSWFDSARFSNWLSNGQGNGDTETGSYNLNGASSGLILPIADAKVRLPSEDEWYKAAYYNGATSTYSLYPNGRNSITTADSNYNMSVGASSNVGSYSHAPSSYGTFDQGGNVWEWNDAAVGTSRGLRGHSWTNGLVDYLSSSFRLSSGPDDENWNFGFRVASVPEPSAMVLTMIASSMMLIRRKR